MGVLGRFGSRDLAMTPTAHGRVLGSVTPDVLPSHQQCTIAMWTVSTSDAVQIGRQPYFMLHSHWRSLTAINQTTSYTTCIYFAFLLY